MANNYLVGINPTSGRLESKQVNDTSILTGPVELYDGNGIYGRDGSGNILFSHSGQAAGSSDYAFPWTTGYSQFFTNGVNHMASGLSSSGPVAIDINDGDRALFNSSWPEGGEPSYVSSSGNASHQAAHWHTNQYLDEGDVVAGTVGSFGAANSIKWSNWTKAAHMENTGNIEIDSKADSIAGSRVQLKTMAGTSTGIIASYYSTQEFITGFNKEYDLYGDAKDGIKVSNLNLRENAQIDGILNVDGDAVFNSDVDLGDATSDTITALARFDSDLTPSTNNARNLGSDALEWKDLWIDGTAHIDTLDVDVNANVDGTLTVTGTTTMNGHVVLGNAAADNITFNGDVVGHITPNADGTQDLGAAALEWRDLFLDGTAHIDTLDVDGSAGIIGNLAVTGTSALTGAVTITGQTNMNGHVVLGNAAADNITFNGDVVGHITPNADGSYDLGAAALEWRDLFLDGTAHIDTLDVDGSAGIIGNLAVSGTSSMTGALTVTGNISSAADVIAYSGSDERLKDNIKVIGKALSKVKTLRGVEFDWNSNQSTYLGHDVGIVAQDVEKVHPEIVTTRDNGYKAVKYERLVPILIEAIKELSDKVDILEGTNRSTSF